MTKPADHRPPPIAAIREVVDVYFGHEIVDPYRWMEDLASAETVEWLAAQNQHARDHLDRLPLRDELLRRVTEVSNAGVTIAWVQRRGARFFYLKLAPGDNSWRLCVREGFAGAERTLAETEGAGGDGRHASITAYQASHDGLLVSYLISPSGSEYGDVYFLDVQSGQPLVDRIERTRWDAGAWLPDGRSLAYLRFAELPADAPPTDRLRNIRVFVHRLGAASGDDTPLFGCDVDPEVVFGDRLIPDVRIPMGSRYAIARVSTGVSPNGAFWLAPLDAIGQARVPWRQVVSLDDEVSEIAIHGDDLYLLTYKDAPRYKVVRTSVTNPDLPGADLVVPESAAIVENIAAARDALYVQTLDGGIRRLLRIDFATGLAEPIDVPNNGSAAIEVADTLHDGLLFSTSSWTRAPALFAYDPASRVARDTGLIPPLPVDMSGIETVVTQVPSHDGVMVPLVILHRRDLVRDGTRPTLLSGYGAYGAAYASPWFRPDLLPWLERGGVYAVAGVRGGGEYGEAWHLAGKEATKPNTWRDFIACAEYLVRERYTSPEHLAGEGTSAGGILISNAIAERPDLFGAAIINVGLTNALRMETTANGVPNIPEFGSCATEEGFKALLAMDAYHKIRPGVRYPAVMLTHGITDPRVNPWFSAKMAARLQAASGADQAVLLRIDYDAGHGIGNTKAQRNSRAADTFAFLLATLTGR